jgi:hypothetical protein
VEKVYLEHIHILCFTANIVGLIKPETVRWEQHVACMGARRNAYRVLVGERTQLEDLGLNGKIILKAS